MGLHILSLLANGRQLDSLDRETGKTEFKSSHIYLPHIQQDTFSIGCSINIDDNNYHLDINFNVLHSDLVVGTESLRDDIGNYLYLAEKISENKLRVVITPQSASGKRIREEARETNYLIDATHGRKTRAIVIMDSNHIILSAMQPETIANRLNDTK